MLFDTFRAKMTGLIDDATAEECMAIQRDHIGARCLQDAVAHAVAYDVAARGNPVTLRQWNARQLRVAYLVAFFYDVDSLDVLPIVARTFPKVATRSYASA